MISFFLLLVRYKACQSGFVRSAVVNQLVLIDRERQNAIHGTSPAVNGPDQGVHGTKFGAGNEEAASP
jgi:hypothetical protein